MSMSITKDNKLKYEPIVFVNKPASNYEQDVVGFKPQVETIKQAIQTGASMIGVIADYGTGKSTISDILVSEVFNNRHLYNPIRINMWDSISNLDGSAKDITELTKSFLFQLAKGNTDQEGLSKLSHHVSKRMSKNYNVISFSSISTKIWKYGLAAAISYGAYKVLSQESLVVAENSLSFIKGIHPAFLVLSWVLLILGVMNTTIAFSNIKKSSDKQFEVNDVFELYDEIADSLVKTSFDNKQIVIIEDLDRINNKKLITEFLKELYRFQNSMSENLKDNFVFIISIKPESLLVTNPKDTVETNLYSKVFDVMVNLKPIHFEDYESALITMLDKDVESKKKLESLLGTEIKEHLPKSFNWVLSGENLTLRDLKDRLNHAISIMVSLKNKDYQGNIKADFETCAAVAYLESAFSDEFYKLVRKERLFEDFIRKSYSIKNKNSEDLLIELKNEFEEHFKDGENSMFSAEFTEIVCKLIRDNVLDDDFRMYFYTYPDKSYIKTVDEKDVCNLIKLPNVYEDFDGLDEKVARIFDERPNSIVIDTIKFIDKEQDYPDVLLINDTLFKIAVECNMPKTIQLIRKNILGTKWNKEKVYEILRRIHGTDAKNKTTLINEFVKVLLKNIIDNSWADEDIIEYRKCIISAFGHNVLPFKTIFTNGTKTMPQITEEEIKLINNIDIVLDLINVDTVDTSMFYLYDAINKEKLSSNSYNKASVVYDTLISKEEIDALFSDKVLDFLFVNNAICLEYFDLITEKSLKVDKICEYVNLFNATELPIEYLQRLDDKAIIGNINDDILDRLREERMFTTYLLNKALIDDFAGINYANEEISKAIINACDRIYEIDTYIFMSVRKNIICTLQKVYKLYRGIFEGAFPVITKDELNSFSEFNNAIVCIDGGKLTTGNCDFVWEYCNQDERNAVECYNLLDYIFNPKYNCVKDIEVAKRLFYSFDFSKLKFKDISEEDKDKILGYLKPLLLNTSQECINVMKHLGELIPAVETIIQSNGDCINDYISLMNDLKAFTTCGIEWLKNANVEMALCAEITTELYEKCAYKNCVIGKTLNDGKLFYRPSVIPAGTYLEIYLTTPSMYEYLVSYKPFIKRVLKEGLHNKVTTAKHAMMFSYVSNDATTFKYAFGLFTSANERRQYISNIPEFTKVEDSVEIQQYLCGENVFKDLGEQWIKRKIMNLLWDDEPAHKKVFSDAWDKKYRKEVDISVD